MWSNSFGEALRITTFGESHGSSMGVVIDGLPSGLEIDETDILQELSLRRPGRKLTSPRREPDVPKIESGVFDGRTTGSPLAITVKNSDVRSEPYESIRFLPRPGHADLPYIIKYGYENWDYRGGGRSSARETVNWVAAGAIAKKLLTLRGIFIAGCLISIGNSKFQDPRFNQCFASRRRPFRTPTDEDDKVVEEMILQAIKEKDSVGGSVRIMVVGSPPGLGDPVFSKIKGDLARASMSTPGSVYFEMGDGINTSRSHGSEVMDSILKEGDRYSWERNLHGGILGGITTGDTVYFSVGFRPTSSIDRSHRTVDLRTGEEASLRIIGRHDPAIAIRGVSVLEGLTSLVFADHLVRTHELPAVISREDMGIIRNNWSRYSIGGAD
ncbi:MAG: chorismate synthase [Candidatus Thermoplasmatota archaeon]|nr:chorismate synthase [Candidatus Thermoplasmatota archaeon]